MFMNDWSIAGFLVTLYEPNGGPANTWDIYDAGEVDKICWSSIRFSGVTYIFLCGTNNLPDWIKDFNAFANPFNHSLLGPCHPGFLIGMQELWQEIKQKTQGPYVVAGHSLGASRACILSGFMTLDNQKVIRRVGFGEPKPGFKQLAEIIKNIPTMSYKNGKFLFHDLVTDVPFSFPPEDYVHPVALTDVCAEPDAETTLKLGIFAWHHMPLYKQALASTK